MAKQREQWGSRIGFILAAAGSAVGLGNIWKFPYTAGENGGGAFLLIYLFFVAVIGFSVMLGEFTLGRKTSLAAAGAFNKAGKPFAFIGVLGVISAFMIMGFYPVVGGWAIAYIFKSVTGLLATPDAIGTVFGGFISASVEPLIWTAIFLLLNVVIVAKGVSSGIETAGKFLMPVLFLILIVISVYGMTLPGAMKGLEFLFMPDFSKVTGSTFLAALGQAFFSLSLGMGCMVTYGSYLKKEENLAANAAIVTGLDTLVAVLAGVAMFPAMFAFGLEPAAGPGLVFVVVPMIFSNFGPALGPVFAALFFIALTIAALTSSVSLMEVAASYFMDEKGTPRKKAVFLVAGGMAALSVLSSLSLGVMSEFKLLGAGVFDVLDLLTDKIFLALGGALTCVVLGHFMDSKEIENEITNNGTIPFPLFKLWIFIMKIFAPVAITIVAIMGISSVPQSTLMVAGVGVIIVGMVFSIWSTQIENIKRLDRIEKTVNKG